MAVSTNAYLKTLYGATLAKGAKVINSDFTFEIEGYEDSYLLCKQAVWPEISPQGEIEISTPLGATMWQPQQLKVAQQGQVTFMETVLGSVDNLMNNLLLRGGTYDAGGITFNAKIYEGTPQHYLRYKRIVDCFLQIDPIDRDWENRSQPLLFSGTLFYHYFGEMVEGNSKDYR